MPSYLRCFAVALLLLIMGAGHASPISVTVVLSEESSGHREFVDALLGELKQNTTITISQSLETSSNPTSDLVIAVGNKAVTSMASAVTSPVLCVLITKETFTKLQRDNPRRSSTFSAIYLDQPIDRQLSILKRAFPHIQHVGVMYGHASPEIRTLRSRAAERGYTLHEQEVSDNNSLPFALQEVINQSEVILALPDGNVYNTSTIRNILLATYRAQIPIVGFSASFARAGAAYAVFSTPEQIAKQAADNVRQFSESRVLPPAQYAQKFEVQLNRQVIQSLGLHIPSMEELERE